VHHHAGKEGESWGAKFATREDGPTYRARRAREIFSLLEWTLMELEVAITRVEERLCDLGERYRIELGGTRLVLARRLKKGNPIPQNLFWAVLISGKLREQKLTTASRWILKRIRGRLTDQHIARFAGDYRNRARYHEYDAERGILNRAHEILARARARVVKILKGRFPRQIAPEFLKALADEAVRRGPWLRTIVVPALHLAEQLAFAEDAVRQLQEDVRCDSGADLRLEVSDEKGRANPRIRWRLRKYGKLGPVTDRVMKESRFPKFLRRALTRWSGPLRRLLRELGDAREPLTKMRQLAESARSVARKMIARVDGGTAIKSLPFDSPGLVGERVPEPGLSTPVGPR
jgi:hypothetical protein